MWLSLVIAIALISAACGGDSESDPDEAGSDGGGNGGGATSGQGSATAASGDGSSGGNPSGGSNPSGGTASLTPIGPVAENTIQIGDQTWQRTLPMAQGQCVVFKDDGTLPDSAITWGTLDGDDDIRFSANQLQDGTFQSEVQGDDFFWIAGARSPGVDDLQIELDFDALTVIGEGTFSNLLSTDLRAGSFHFKCLPEDQ